MTLRICFIALLMICTATASSMASNLKIVASEAGGYVGQEATVCGNVVSTNYAYKSKGQPTFINLDEPYPNHIFTVVIFGNNRKHFGSPEESYRGKAICISGLIKSHRGKPQIIAKNPSQIELIQ